MQNNLILESINSLIETQDNSENYTLIEAGSKKYAVKTQNVLEIVKVMELDYIHDLPSCILGIIKYEQTPVGVIDLREVFREKRVTYDLSAKILMLKAQNGICAMICDNVYDIKKLNNEDIHQLPYSLEAAYFEGVYIKDDENIYLINIDNIKNYIEQNPDKFPNVSNEKYIVDDELSRKTLKGRKNFLAKVITDVQNNTALYDKGVSFSIDGIKYYINMASVKEFYKVNKSKFIKVPNTRACIFGLINIKGDYITVLDIRELFNNSKTEIKEKSTIIILNSDEFKLGILADEICENMDIDFEEIVQNKIQKQEEGKMMEFVLDGEIYQIIDVEKLLEDERLIIV